MAPLCYSSRLKLIIRIMSFIACLPEVFSGHHITNHISKKVPLKAAGYMSLVREKLLNLDIETVLKNQNLTDEKICEESFLRLTKEQIEKDLDASGKPSSNILGGNIHWLGSYQECRQNNGSHFCTMSNIILGGKWPIVLGLCVPEICEAHGLTKLLSDISKVVSVGNLSLFAVYNNTNSVNQYGVDAVCYDEEKSYNSGAIAMMIVSFLILLLCFLGTVTEIIHDYIKSKSNQDYMLYIDDNDDDQFSNIVNQKEEPAMKEQDKMNISMHTVKLDSEGGALVKFLVCFSLIKNTKDLFDTTVPKGAITSINGIRTLSIMWVIQGHILVVGMANVDNPMEIVSWFRRFTMETLLNATVSVDSFFFLSGLLVGYLSMKRFELKGKLPLLRYYVHRYIRLTPSYAFVIFFSAYIFPIISSGPSWFMQAPASTQVQNCIKYWWTNLLYVNNLYPDPSKMCYGVSWYLANDMQFYVISPIILWCMYKFKLLGVILANGTLMLSCFITNGVLMYHYDASPILYEKEIRVQSTDSPVMRYQKYLYGKPYTRILPYLVGLVLGYIIMKKHVIIGNFKYMAYSVGWVLAIGMGIACVYGPFTATEHMWNQATMITFGIMFRFVWAVALGWVVYACHNGFGGLVNNFLSWRAFIPLSRLTYATYLTHILVVEIFFSASQVSVDLSLLNYVYLCSGITVLSYATAYILSVCVEYPVFNLEKLLFKF